MKELQDGQIDLVMQVLNKLGQHLSKSRGYIFLIVASQEVPNVGLSERLVGGVGVGDNLCWGSVRSSSTCL